MNRLSTEKRIQLLHCFCEGMSLRATGRLCDTSIVAVLKFYLAIGEACQAFQEAAFKNLACARIQMDEVWSYCYAKARNVPSAKAPPPQAGDLWTWTAMDADSRAIFAWHTGGRSFQSAELFMQKVRACLVSRPQITADGLLFYVPAIERNFGADVDFAQLVKIFGKGSDTPNTRYSPPPCIGAQKKVVIGSPDPAHVSTSYMERANLTLRMHNRRFTRLTNGFSKKSRNHALGVAITYFYYNFVQIHGSLRCTPAMAAGVFPRVMELREIVEMLERTEATRKKAA